MVLRLKNIEIPVAEYVGNPHEQDGILKKLASKKLNISQDFIQSIRIHKKSLDARKKSKIVYHFQLDIELSEKFTKPLETSPHTEIVEDSVSYDPLEGLRGLTFRHLPVVIGTGPAGIFAASILAQAGQPCIIVERGEPVERRLKTVGKLRRGEGFSEKSNYCFGEGGAGTFSDGKLTCGRNHPYIKHLFKEWVRCGAPQSILYEAHPHIGTDFLMRIAINQREELKSLGCQFLFDHHWIDFTYNGDLNSSTPARYSLNLRSPTGDVKILTDHLIVAIGHSARDTYEMLHEKNLEMAPKPFAMGARFEHPQDSINKIQFGSCSILPAAEYKLATQKGDRGIWTFCMCPGGHLLPTNAQAGHLAINGMSYYSRNSSYANAAIVVNVVRQDFFKGHTLDGMYFQAEIEKKAFLAGGENYHAPAQRLIDFLEAKQSQGTLKSTYEPGITPSRLDKILPDFIVHSLKGAVTDYDKKMRGFIHPEAMIVGVETKTSSPVVMTRDKTFQSVSHPGFFPAGEGAGFAGGIVSAALDGLRVGRAVLETAVVSS